MRANRNYAWAVVVFTDSCTESALVSGIMLKKSETCASVVAVVSANTSGEIIKKLDTVFDMVIVGHLDHTVGPEMMPNGWSEMLTETDLLMMSTLKLKLFTKLIVVTSGTCVLQQMDYLFDDNDYDYGYNGILTMDDTGKEWRMVRIQPGSRFIKQRKLFPSKACGWVDLLVESKQRNCPVQKCKNADNPFNLDWHAEDGLVYVHPTVAKQLLSTSSGSITQQVFEAQRELDKNDWVAIVGMSCRLPDANSPEEYWNILNSGQNTCSVPPHHRQCLISMDPEIKANFLKCPIDQFDTAFFGISPKEARFTDPQARLLLEVSWEAVEDARMSPQELRGSKTGVFCGSFQQDYREAMTNNQAGASHLRKYLCNGFGSTSSKLSYFYGFTGPNISTESACSSSMVAVAMAMKSLQKRECPLALACGVNLMLFVGKQNKMFAPDGKSKVFDVHADGYARAEGIAVLVMKRYSDAIRDHDNIHGVIRGSGQSQEGLSKSFGTPTVESESDAMREALDMANVDPSQVDYVEAHATGTSIGDPIEALAIVKAYSGGEREQPLCIGSGKTNIGHTESCSGIASIIKVLLSLKHEIIPRHINLTEVNPKVNFDGIPGTIPLNNVEWPRKAERPRIAGVSSFGITGTDVHLIIQEAPSTPQSKDNFVPLVGCSETQLLSISAKSEVALEQMTVLFSNFLETSQESLASIIYSANAHRPHHKFRRTILAATKSEMVANIKASNYISSAGSTAPSKPKICFTFPGRMGPIELKQILALYNNNPFFKNTMDHCHKIFRTVTGYSISLLSILNSPEVYTDPSDEEVQVRHGLLFTIQYSLSMLWMHWGVQPTSVLGHCAGEIIAGVVCGILRLEDAFEMTKILPHFLQCQRDQPTSAMAIGWSRSKVELAYQQFIQLNDCTTCPPSSQWIEISSANSQQQTLVTGPSDYIFAFNEFCCQHGARCKILPVQFGLHSRAVEPARDAFMKITRQITHHPKKIPFISSVTGKVLGDSEVDATFWFRVLRECVNFEEACSTALEGNLANVYLEIGLGGVLTKLMRCNFGESGNAGETLCVASFSSFGMLRSVAEVYTFGVNIDWKAWHHDNKMEGKSFPRVKLPNYPFQKKSYWFESHPIKKQLTSSIDNNSGVVHPLLGMAMEAPASLKHVQFFQNNLLLALNQDNTCFIMDHKVETKIIFPAAAYLEMIIAAWKHCSTDHSKIASINNFQIHAALLIDQSAEQRIQCVVDKEKMKASVFSSSNSSDQHWKLHAEAEILVKEQKMAEFEEGFISRADLNWTSAQEIDAASEAAAHFYARLAHLGLFLKNAFNSIKYIYTDLTDGSTTAKVECKPGNMESLREFICHPVLIDAMLQTYIFHRKLHLKKLPIPVKVGTFTITTTLPEYSFTAFKTWYIRCQSGHLDIALLDAEMRIVAIMEKPEFVGTTKESVITAAAEAGFTANSKIDAVTLYQDVWQKTQLFQPTCSPDDAKSTLDDLQINDLNLSQNLTKRSGDWLLFQIGLKGVQEFKNYMEICTNRNVILLPITHLEGMELYKFISEQLEMLKDTLEGIIFWLVTETDNEKQLEDICSKSRTVLESLLVVSKYLEKIKLFPRVTLVTNGSWGDDVTTEQGSAFAQAWGFVRTLRMERPELKVASIDLECEGSPNDQAVQVLHNLWLDDDGEVKYISGNRYVRRLLAVKENSFEDLIIPNEGQYRIELPDSRNIAHVSFKGIPENEERVVGEHQVKVDVCSVALNFKDVLAILKPSPEFMELSSIGLDFSGIVVQVGAEVNKWKVGDLVLGCDLQGKCMQSQVIAQDNSIIAVPNEISMAEAATLPLVFLTAWHCMVNVAKLSAGQTILVHAAAGGVGLAAIQIAKILGVNVIATAGTHKKRRFVRSLGVEHVFNSRTLEFREDIQRVLMGGEVDAVLNCLTGPGFKEASLEVCRDGGYFVEISKLDIWTEEQVKIKRPLVKYQAVDLTKVDNGIILHMMATLSTLLTEGKMKPLSYVVYPASRLVDALVHLQKARHIGKIVINLPRNCGGGRRSEFLFNDRSTYLITGGLGAIGFGVCKWMITQGARYIVLVGRSEPNEERKEEIAHLERDNKAVIICKQIDISDLYQCRQLIERELGGEGMPPLRGVHHCAGVISDKLIVNQDWTNFEKVLKPKVVGAWNLHKITQTLPLEFFVLYSSAAATFGNVGQVNYVAANAYLNSLAQYRRSFNLAAASINWGVWKGGLAEGIQLKWAPAFSVDEGISALERFMKYYQNEGNIVAGKFDLTSLMMDKPYHRKFLEHLNLEQRPPQIDKANFASKNKKVYNGEEVFGRYKQLDEPEKRYDLVRSAILEIICDTMGTLAEEITDDGLLSEMGMDSLMSIEFSNKIRGLVNDILVASGGNHGSANIIENVEMDLEENGTLTKLAQYVFSISEKFLMSNAETLGI